jgi:holin-like protein
LKTAFGFPPAPFFLSTRSSSVPELIARRIMISALTQLLLFQLIGEVIARSLSLPVPGPVIGMVLLFIALSLRGGPSEDLQRTSQNLLQHLSLLFVPAGTGIMIHLHRVADEWLPLLLSLVISTLATLVVTALVMKFCLRFKHPEAGSPGEAS